MVPLKPLQSPTGVNWPDAMGLNNSRPLPVSVELGAALTPPLMIQVFVPEHAIGLAKLALASFKVPPFR